MEHDATSAATKMSRIRPTRPEPSPPVAGGEAGLPATLPPAAVGQCTAAALVRLRLTAQPPVGVGYLLQIGENR